MELNDPHTNPETNPLTATLKQQLLIRNNCYSQHDKGSAKRQSESVEWGVRGCL
jgi:hypothetical protein